MTVDTIVTPPSVSWAQCNDKVYLTFNVECEKPDIKIEKSSVSFRGTCSPNQTSHEVVIPTYADLEPEKSSYVNKGRHIEVVLCKLDADQPFWPTLTSDKKKHHWLKVDFNRWHDEDDSDEDLGDMFSSKLGDFGDDNEDDAYPEEEDLPDLE